MVVPSSPLSGGGGAVTWPAERVAGERDRLLRETVEIAYCEVPFYRELMDRRRLKPADIRQRFPKTLRSSRS